MTNQEKAIEIAKDVEKEFPLEGDFEYEYHNNLWLAACKMAEWKDKQYKNSPDGVKYILKAMEKAEDAMIDKACEWLKNVPLDDMTFKYHEFCTSDDWYNFIDDFKKAMKNETESN